MPHSRTVAVAQHWRFPPHLFIIFWVRYSLWLGLVPEPSVGNVWNSTTAWGMEHLGDLGMFVYMKALATHPGDGGAAAVKALTKCDQDSWCNEIRARDATI